MTLVAGIDVVSIDAVTESLTRFGDRYRTRLFSERELAECETNHEIAANGLALRFAAKEAVLKALRPDDRIPPWRAIEVQLPLRGGAKVELAGAAAELARQRGIETIALSVSCAHGFAIATVIGEVARNQMDENV